MRDRIEPNRKQPVIPIPGRVMHELCAHALDVVPEECCGLISSNGVERFSEVHRISNVMTRKHLADAVAFPLDARHAYYMSEIEYLRARKDVEARGQRITAVYHSHVGTDAYLSEEDIAYAEHPLFPFPGAAQIVLSVLGDRVGAAAVYLADPNTGVFDRSGGRLLEVVDS